MGLKNMFRRKSGKPSGKKTPSTDEPGVRGNEDATLMLDGDESTIRETDQATGDSPIAATVVIRSPILEAASGDDAAGRSPDDTTERLVTPDLAATVAVEIPDFDADTSEPAAASEGAPVAFAPRGVGTETEDMATPGAMAATVAVTIPDFDANDTPAVPQPVPEASAQAPQSADTDSALKRAVPAEAVGSVSETIAVPMQAAAESLPSPPPSAPVDATVAVAIPDFDEPSDATGRLAASDATVAVSGWEVETNADATAELKPYPDPADATVAVSVPIFEDSGDAGSDPEPAGAGPDATVAVVIPDLPDALASAKQPVVPSADDASLSSEAPPIGSVPGPSAASLEGPLPADPNDATRFDLPDATSDLPEVAGVLVAVDGELAGFVCAIRDGETKLGRSESCDVVLSSMKISRQHTTIVHQDGVFAILPLAEKNPTYVNGDVITGCELSDGDSIRMGRTTFRFRTIQGL